MPESEFGLFLGEGRLSVSVCGSHRDDVDTGPSDNTRKGCCSFYLASNWTTESVRVFRGSENDHFISNRQQISGWEEKKQWNLLLFVRFLYMIRCPHSLHRIGSRGLISFFAPQSVLRKGWIMADKKSVGGCVHLRTDTPFLPFDP